jgi:hypothetical protein
MKRIVADHYLANQSRIAGNGLAPDWGSARRTARRSSDNDALTCGYLG